MAAYPTLSSGAIAQLPYTEIDEWNTSQSALDCGKVFTWSEHTNTLRSFVIEYACLTSAELQTIENFFVSMGGRVGTFDFTDDAGEVLSGCRFDMDEFMVRYLGPNECAVTVRIAAPKF